MTISVAEKRKLRRERKAQGRAVLAGPEMSQLKAWQYAIETQALATWLGGPVAPADGADWLIELAEEEMDILLEECREAWLDDETNRYSGVW